MEIEKAIERAKNNDQKAFNYLLDVFWDNVYGFQLKRTENENDAEDITIQTFSKAFDKIKVKVLGISKDSPKSHVKFRDKYDLKFTLLSDEDVKVINKYGIWKEKSMYGKKYMGIERTTFIIDEKGKIEKIFPKVKVNGHVDAILKYLSESMV